MDWIIKLTTKIAKHAPKSDNFINPIITDGK